MFKTYLTVLALYAALVSGTHSVDPIKQTIRHNIDHDIIDGDNRNAFANVFKDSYTSMIHLRDRNLSFDEIHLVDDSFVQFHNISFTKLPCAVNSTSMIFKCALGKHIQILLPLGCYKVNGSFETTGTEIVHPFAISLQNVVAKFTMMTLPQSHTIRDETDITIDNVDINSDDPNADAVSIILHHQISEIKSQILEQFHDQIKTHELKSYSSTAKKYCFDLQDDTVKQYYQINQTYVEPPLTIDGVKIKNFSFSFILWLYQAPDFMSFYFYGSNSTLSTVSYHYGTDEAGTKVAKKYNLILGYPSVDGETSLDSRDIAPTARLLKVSFVGNRNASRSATEEFLKEKVRRMVVDDLDFVIRRAYVEIVDRAN